MKKGFWFTVVMLCVPGSSLADDVLVAVASNFAATLTRLQSVFETNSQHRLRISTGSSGKLFAQITNGAPFQIFLAADGDYPRRLIERGAAVAGTQFTYATGRLIAWSPMLRLSADLRELADPGVRHIAIANPETAPYGFAAVRALEYFGLAEKTRGKWVIGENVAQTAQFVATRNAEAGFIALAQLYNIAAPERGFSVEIPAIAIPSLAHDAVLLEPGRESAAARAFLDFLRGDAARTIIQHAGYN